MLYWVTASSRKGMGVSTEKQTSLDVFLAFRHFLFCLHNLLSSIFLENRFRIRPEGVWSKKAMGEFMIDFSMSPCT